MQQYVHEHADPRIVRVPKVFDAFTLTQPEAAAMTYIVMENIEGDDFTRYRDIDPQTAEEAIQAVADAVRHIWDIPPPPNSTLGPLGMQRPADRFFSGCGAEREFSTVLDLEDWVNAKPEQGGYPDRVVLEGESLGIYATAI